VRIEVAFPETLTLVGGDQKVVWTGTGTVQAFNDGLRANRCELDISGFAPTSVDAAEYVLDDIVLLP